MTEYVDRLFDFATDNAGGFTRDDACAALGIGQRQFIQAVNELRRILDDGTLTLTCTPSGQREQWTYRLVGDLSDVEPWVENRLGDAETRMETMVAMITPIVAGTDGRTRNGRRSREMLLAFRQLKERLDFLDEVLS